MYPKKVWHEKDVEGDLRKLGKDFQNTVRWKENRLEWSQYRSQIP
jgi:hypothetical protein